MDIQPNDRPPEDLDDETELAKPSKAQATPLPAFSLSCEMENC